MATIIREVLTATGMRLPLVTTGQTKVGVNLSGTWVGNVPFFAANDGLNFLSKVTVTPFPSGTGIQQATANGNWEFIVTNYAAFQVGPISLTSGSVSVVIAASQDASYQDAFLASTSKYVNQAVTGGAANVVTQTAQTNRAWRLRSLAIGFSVAPAAAVLLTLSDGASATLWEGYVPPLLSYGAATVGGTWQVPLPPIDPQIPNSGGLVGTPGNSFVITLAAPGGSVKSEIDAEFMAA